jgi:phospholipid/cholesterol/gamma-HCH transport system substrate-binding protein
MRNRTMELWVGIFILLGAVALFVLAFKVSGLTESIRGNSYALTAVFDNIGGLKIRAPVKIAGVRIGEVSNITLDPANYRALVEMSFNRDGVKLPTDTSANIYTAGLLGANYVELSPGFDQTYLKDGEQITTTHPALILENLIGQFLFKLGKS